MMRVRLTKQLGIHAKGSEHEVSDATGRRLIRKRRRRQGGIQKAAAHQGSTGARWWSLPKGMQTAANVTGQDEPLEDTR